MTEVPLAGGCLSCADKTMSCFETSCSSDCAVATPQWDFLVSPHVGGKLLVCTPLFCPK